MRIVTPNEVAKPAGNKYLGVLVAAKFARYLNDFPKDHFHHRGLFWAWPHVRVGGEHHDLWMLQGIAHRFEKWIEREADATGATLAAENGWYVGERRVMREEGRLRAWPSGRDSQALEV